MAVLDPIKLIIDNYPEGNTEELEAINNPEDKLAGSRMLPFSKTLYIERDDFMENPPKKYFRLAPGKEVRLRYAYFVTCTSVDKDNEGNITAVHCSYDSLTKGGNSLDGRKVKGTIHWVDSNDCLNAEIRLFDRLFKTEVPDKTEPGKTFIDNLNPDSLKIVKNAKLERSLAAVKHLDKFQFERLGYFSVDYDSKKEKLVFNRTCTLRDSWTKQNK